MSVFDFGLAYIYIYIYIYMSYDNLKITNP